MSSAQQSTTLSEMIVTDYKAVDSGRAQTLSVSTYETAKRIFDITVSLGLLIFVAPVMLVIALVVKLTSRGPVIFKQKRLGQAGQEFWCLKFRTMVVDAEEQLRRREDLRKMFDENFKIKNDPRLTRPGGFLRKTSLDELPQLINVLRGDLSLIGPRPIVPHERHKYAEHADKLLSVKPGLGGYWQVYGRSNTSYDQRVRMDMEYIERRSFWFDLKLMFLTAYVVLRRRGAY